MKISAAREFRMVSLLLVSNVLDLLLVAGSDRFYQ